MKRAFHLLVPALLLASLSACDYRNTPGVEPFRSQDFSTYPPARATETNLDSITGRQDVYEPGGVGSAADQQTSVDAGLNAAPGNANSPTAGQPEQSAQTQSTARE
ncbi:hypothetical protein [Hymenobacter weizhouensis]|uniref:hypothetical protein n=1 Tax=Hymenobacter sp. YIM 151500-1 TaxID=2987689 RepID=UPI0022269B75|nr:hypothetical protein [Hymenobacter sp. YIM 151500-1]UYZ63444.1 hypothetical protein OIS53_01035 [Hymenobacter sp. YIM 151500-1]